MLVGKAGSMEAAVVSGAGRFKDLLYGAATVIAIVSVIATVTVRFEVK
jgi:hypothetical protein